MAGDICGFAVYDDPIKSKNTKYTLLTLMISTTGAS